MKTIPKEVRDQFEDFAYRNYEAARMSAALQGATVRAKMTREQYLKRDAKDEYENAAVALTFLGWKLAIEALLPTIEAAHLWVAWANINDRIAAELPEHYTVVLGLEREEPEKNSGFYIELMHFPPDEVTHSELSGTTTIKHASESVEYPNPVDMDSPGLLQRTLESALEAAKAHHAKGLN